MLEYKADNSLNAQTNPPLTSSRITFIAHFVKVRQALRSELNIVCDTISGRDLSERSELSRLFVEQLQCFMNTASACGFLSDRFLCPLKESGHGNIKEM